MKKKQCCRKVTPLLHNVMIGLFCTWVYFQGKASGKETLSCGILNHFHGKTLVPFCYFKMDLLSKACSVCPITGILSLLIYAAHYIAQRV